MNCTELHDRLAEYLGDEIDAASRSGVEQHLANCPACAAEVRGLHAAQHALRSGVPTSAAAEAATAQSHWATVRAAADGAEARQGGRTLRRALTALRYAAVIGLAFIGGYFWRGENAGSVPVQLPPALVTAAGNLGPDAPLAVRYRSAGTAFPKAPSFCHSLVALARR